MSLLYIIFFSVGISAYLVYFNKTDLEDSRIHADNSTSLSQADSGSNSGLIPRAIFCLKFLCQNYYRVLQK